MATLKGSNLSLQAISNLESLRSNMHENALSYLARLQGGENYTNVRATMIEDAPLYLQRVGLRAALDAASRSELDDALTNVFLISLPAVNDTETELTNAANLQLSSATSANNTTQLTSAINSVLAAFSPAVSLF